MTRKLAQTAVVWDIIPIEGADKIELIKVLGWECISLKGEFKKYDKCVYFEIDSILDPSNPVFAFMEPTKFRVKTKKLGNFKVISQGLALPLNKFPELSEDHKETGADLTGLLKIRKWETSDGSETLTSRGSFPSCVPKTDETRIQASPALLEEFKDKLCYIALKCDGSSGTFVYNNGEYDVCSRNNSVKDTEGNVWWHLSKKHSLEEKLKAKGNFAIQGEVCSSKIQKNKLQVTEPTLFVFNIYDVDKGRHLGYVDFIAFCKELELQTVPILDDNFTFNHTVNELLELSKGFYEGTKNPREGIVIRPIEGCYSKILRGRLSVKVINNDYLIKNGE